MFEGRGGQDDVVDEHDRLRNAGLGGAGVGEPVVGSCGDRGAVPRLEVAQQNLEACDADDELKKLALECLTASRVARPKNAGEVARRVREFLTSSEERTRRAESAQREAEIKARGARRAG